MDERGEEIAELRATVTQLSERVERIEALLRSGDREAPVPRSVAKPRVGVALINRAGAVTVTIGIIFFFKYAVDERLIGAWGGVVFGVLVGVALVVAGDWLNRRDQRVLAQGIAGCGFAALYISLYAASAFYQLIPRSAGFAGLVLVCGLAAGLSVRFDSAAIAALGFIGAPLTPWLLHNLGSEVAMDCVYLLAVNVTSTEIAVRRRSPALGFVTGPLTLLAAYFLFLPTPRWFVVTAACVGAAHFAGALRARSENRSRDALYIAGHISLLAAAMRTVGFWVHDSAAYQVDSMLLACWGIAALAYGMRTRSLADRRLGLALLGIVVAKLYLWDVWSLERVYRITAFLVLGALLLVASWVYSRKPVSNKLL